jgi:hypothetical protein
MKMSGISQLHTSNFRFANQHVLTESKGKNEQTVGRFSDNVLRGLDKAVNLNPVFNLTPGSIGTLRKTYEVAQLGKAEALAQDAYKRAHAPNANHTDKLEAQEEMQKAEAIRKDVEKDLSPLQQQALEIIIKEEKHGLELAPYVGDYGEWIAQREMTNGASDSASLDSWIRSS